MSDGGLQANIEGHWEEQLIERAEAAEAERDAAREQVAALREAVTNWLAIYDRSKESPQAALKLYRKGLVPQAISALRDALVEGQGQR